jgi:predicted CopG family antitoxin
MVSNLKKYNLKLISVSQKNYDSLRKFGEFGDSFDDVITKILNKVDSIPAHQHGVSNC